MKKLFTVFSLFVILLLSSFKENKIEKVLQNGHYLVKLDKEYKEQGLNDFEFTLENQSFIHKVKDKVEPMEIVWIDDTSFKVKGLTEPSNPTKIEKVIMESASSIYFRITKQENNQYHFVLGEELDEHPIYSGKIIKIK